MYGPAQGQTVWSTATVVLSQKWCAALAHPKSSGASMEGEANIQYRRNTTDSTENSSKIIWRVFEGDFLSKVTQLITWNLASENATMMAALFGGF